MGKFLLIAALSVASVGLIGLLLFGPDNEPKLQEEAPIPDATAYIIDQSGVLTSDQRDEINDQLKKMDTDKAQVAVLINPNSGGYGLDNYSLKVAEKWGVGNKDDDGILIVILTELPDRGIRIETGYGAETFLTAGEAGQILDNYVLPKLKDGKLDYYGAIKSGLAALSAEINKQ